MGVLARKTGVCFHAVQFVLLPLLVSAWKKVFLCMYPLCIPCVAYITIIVRLDTPCEWQPAKLGCLVNLPE